MDMVFSTTFCDGMLAEEGVYIIYLKLYITVFCQMSALEAKNPGHSEHTTFLSQQIEFWHTEKTSQNWFKGMRFNWPNLERFSIAVQSMKAEIKLRLADYGHNFLKKCVHCKPW